jgi:hypothetical protein
MWQEHQLSGLVALPTLPRLEVSSLVEHQPSTVIIINVQGVWKHG